MNGGIWVHTCVSLPVRLSPGHIGLARNRHGPDVPPNPATPATFLRAVAREAPGAMCTKPKAAL